MRIKKKRVENSNYKKKDKKKEVYIRFICIQKYIFNFDNLSFENNNRKINFPLIEIKFIS
jgi:hypothetical protein